jgi:Protein of unknown function (DUF4238)
MKHHYVPVFYQKLFAASDGLLWVYDRKLKSCKPLHPLAVCFQNDLYAFEDTSAPNQIVETQFLSVVDGSASAAFKKLPTVLAEPPQILLAEIIYFTALQYLRVPANKRFISALAEIGGNDMMEAAFGNLERAAASLKEYAARTGEELGVTDESMVEAVTSGEIRAVPTERPFLQSVLERSEKVAEVFRGLDIKILVSPPQVGFVLSDNPVTLVSRHGERAGFRTSGSFIFMPLTRHLCLRLGQPGSGHGPKHIDRETVRCINENTASNSDRFVMGPSKIQLESVIRRSGSENMNHTERWTIKKALGKDGILREVIAQPRSVHYVNV